MRSTLLRRILLAAVVLAALLAFVWNLWFRPVAVESFTLTRGEFTVEVMGTGTLQARIASIVSPRIQGRIAELPVDQGDHVKQGDLLVALDDADLRRQFEVAEATVAVNQAALVRLHTDQQRASAVLRQARLEHDRILDAYATGAASTTERDRAIERLEIAEAEVARAQAAQVEAQNALVATQRSLDLARAQLEHAEIRSPFDAMIVRRDRDRGDVVVPGSSILRIVAIDTLWISAWIDETAIARLEPAQPARVIFRAEPERNFQGHIARLGREVDPELREFIVDVAVDELPQTWAVGQRAEVYITTDRADDALAIPAEFLVVRSGITGVWLHQRGRAYWQPVEIGLRGRNMIEITAGLDAGDSVLRPGNAAGQRQLWPGRRVALP